MAKKEMETIEELLEKVETYNANPKELEMIKNAYAYAFDMHYGVKRLTGEDYICHPLAVASILTNIKADAATISAALLHDVLEDCEVSYEELANEFGNEIADLVDGVTKINKLNFDKSKGGSAEIATQRKILVGLSKDVRVIIIKLADRLHNMRTLWVHSEEKQKRKAQETLDILTPIANRLGMSTIKGELEDLCLRYLKPDVYFFIVEELNHSKADRDAAVNYMMEKVSALLDKNGIKHEIKGRAKSIYSIYKKLAKGKKFKDIYDLYALRVFVDKEEECYHALGTIHGKYRPLPKRFKDYIAMPKTNMYQSLHTTVFGEDGYLFEIQIRTYEMDEIAERGIASHWAYKENNSNNVSTLMKNTMEQKLQFFRSLIELNNEETDDEDFINSVKHDIFDENVYVFTPMGDVIELPRGATPIDFAYKVHSDVGDKMVGAIVNNNIVPLNYELQDNDIVKINTNKNSSGPSYEWLNIVKTNQARNKIRSFFNRIDKELLKKKGEELLNKELRRRKIPFTEIINDDNLALLLPEMKVKNLDELYIVIGNNQVTPGSIINIISDERETKEEIILRKKMGAEETIDNRVKGDIIVSGIDDIKINVASCCKPIPGDSIVGYITKGAGITVHRINCPNVQDLEERIIDTSWNIDITKKYATSLMVRAIKTDHLLLDIISKTSNRNMTVQSINTTNDIDYMVIHLTVLVNDLESLNKFIVDCNNISDVLLVERTSK